MIGKAGCVVINGQELLACLLTRSIFPMLGSGSVILDLGLDTALLHYYGSAV